jgi:hypothetical protein
MVSRTDYQQGLTFQYDRAEQVPEQCFLATKLLDAQPLFDGYSPIEDKCKIISLVSWADTKIFDIFNSNIGHFIRDRNTRWEIHGFRLKEGGYADANCRYIDQGLSLWLHNDLKRCPLETLKQAYSDVYSSMRAGWVESKPEDYPDILHKENSEQFALFVKKSFLADEDDLIRFLASKFGLKGQVNSNGLWLKEDVGSCYNDKIYMWIERKELPKIVETFGFDIPIPASS